MSRPSNAPDLLQMLGIWRVSVCVAREETTMLARGYQVRHSVSLRMPQDVLEWLILKSGEAELPVATYTVKRLKELARQDLVQRGEVQGDLLRATSDE